VQTPRKLNKSKRVKRKEADLMGFKLIINKQGQFITELKSYPMEKIPLHFKKENAGVIIAMLRECKTNFTDLHEHLEKVAKTVFHS
jgi:DNA-binding HxlR family transcriptional regulator